jgi:TPR repeat protein
LKTAFSWFNRAASEHNSPTAQFEVGNLYRFGRGVDQDMNVAVSWYEKAAVQGNSDAMYALGQVYWTGEGLERKIDAAIGYYRDAYLNGRNDALRLLTDALNDAQLSEKEKANVMVTIGYIYAQKGPQQDLKLAMRYYVQAWKKGSVTARLYLYGLLVDTGKTEQARVLLINNILATTGVFPNPNRQV